MGFGGLLIVRAVTVTHKPAIVYRVAVTRGDTFFKTDFQHL